MYARVAQAMAQVVLKPEKLSHIIGTAPIIESRAFTVSVDALSQQLAMLAVVAQLVHGSAGGQIVLVRIWRA